MGSRSPSPGSPEAPAGEQTEESAGPPSAGAAETARLRRALAASEAARGAAERLARQQARRYELLLNLATLPDLSLEAAPVVDEAPPGGGAAPPEPGARQARVREDTLRATLRHLVGVIRDGLGAGGVALLLFAGEGRRLRVAGSTSSLDRALAGEGWAHDPLLRRVVEGREPLLWPAARRRGRGAPEDTDLLRRLGAGSLAAAPVAVEGEVRGVLLATAARPGAFAGPDLSFLALVAARLGLLLERAALAAAPPVGERQGAQAAARQQLLSIVTHELKTPVAVQRAYTELLLSRAQKAGRAEEVELLERVDEQAARLLALMEQVLDLQRLDAGLFPLEVARVDLGALAGRLVPDLQVAHPDVRLRLEVEAPADGPARVEARADRRRIEQVLTNLLQNAVRFSPPDGEVVIRVRRGPGAAMALVSVSDGGPGIAEEDRPRIFDRFYQGKGGAGLHRGHEGLGVGLHIAREIVSRHGGDLWLESAGPAEGATFTFSLPASGLPAPPGAAP